MRTRIAIVAGALTLALTIPAAARDDAPAADPAPAAAQGPSPEAPSPEAPPEWGIAGPYRMDVHAIFGVGSRLDDPPLFEQTERFGGIVGAGVGLELSRRIALGLTYEYVDLGTERSGVTTLGTFSISRAVHGIWLDVSAYPVRGEFVGMYLAIAAGLAVQDADLDASQWSALEPGRNISYFCSGGGELGFGLRGAVGVDARLGPVRLLLDVGLANQRLDDELMDDCVPGAGTITALSTRLGIGYAWDL